MWFIYKKVLNMQQKASKYVKYWKQQEWYRVIILGVGVDLKDIMKLYLETTSQKSKKEWYVIWTLPWWIFINSKSYEVWAVCYFGQTRNLWNTRDHLCSIYLKSQIYFVCYGCHSSMGPEVTTSLKSQNLIFACSGHHTHLCPNIIY